MLHTEKHGGVSYACWGAIAVAGFVHGDWADRAAGMMAERAESAQN